MNRLSDIASNIFTALVVGGVLILMGTQMITPELQALAWQWLGAGAGLWDVVLIWLNRLALVGAVALVIYALYKPAKQAVGIGQVDVKLVD